MFSVRFALEKEQRDVHRNPKIVCRYLRRPVGAPVVKELPPHLPWNAHDCEADLFECHGIDRLKRDSLEHQVVDVFCSRSGGGE